MLTGGAGGLGRSIASIYGMRGVGVAILDVRAPDGGKEMESGCVVEALGESVRWYKCDVGDIEEVRRVQMLVEKDVCSNTSRIQCPISLQKDHIPLFLRHFSIHTVCMHNSLILEKSSSVPRQS